MLISFIVVIISQCIHISKNHIVYLKYIQFLFVSYTLIKLEEKKKNEALKEKRKKKFLRKRLR